MLLLSSPRARIAAKALGLTVAVAAASERLAPTLVRFAAQEKHLQLVLFAALCLACLASLLACACLPWRRVRGALAVPLVTCFVVEWAFAGVAGGPAELTDMDLLLSNTAFLGEAVAAYAGQVLWSLPAAVLFLLAFVVDPGARLRVVSAAALPALLASTLAVGGVMARTDGGTSAFPVPIRTLALAGVVLGNPLPALERAPLPFAPERPSELDKIVLVIDESIRPDFVRPANPNLDLDWHRFAADSIVDFGVATAGANCSAASNVYLRLGMTPEKILTERVGNLANPTLWQYARAAGFETVYVTTLPEDENLMTADEREGIDELVRIEPGAGPQRDAEAGRRLRERLAGPGRHFVVVLKAGAHFHYEESYPAENAVFSPHLASNEPLVDRERLRNSYRNAVKWSVDEFFRAAVAGVDLSRALVLYTSDHGQNLLDDGKPITHCRATNPHASEFRVPLIAMTTRPELRTELREAARSNLDRASHFHVFPTLLRLMGYPETRVTTRYGPGLLDPDLLRQPSLHGDALGRFQAPRLRLWGSS